MTGGVAFNAFTLFAVILIGVIILIVWAVKKNKSDLDKNALRLAELRSITRRTVEEEAEVIKLEAWFRRYENQTRPPNPPSSGS